MGSWWWWSSNICKRNLKVKSKVKLKLRTVKLNVKVKVNVKENLKLKDKVTTSVRWPLYIVYNTVKRRTNISQCHFSKCQFRAVEAFKEVGPKLVRQLVAIYRLDKTHACNICMFISCFTFSGWTLPCLDTAHKNTWTLPDVEESFRASENIMNKCTMWKLKNEPKSVQLWKHFSPWMLMLKVPNFKQRYLNSPKMEICENIWKYLGKVGEKFQKSWRGWLLKSRLV